MTKIVHLTSSRFFGGPERQMLCLAETLCANPTTRFVSFSEGGRCRPFLNEVRQAGFAASELEYDTPRLLATYFELRCHLRQWRPDLLVCHGYKANLLGLLAARRLKMPVVSVSRGWTAECARVRAYEFLDRRVLRWMDHVVAVSQAQADKLYAADISKDRVTVIPNAVDCRRFASPDAGARDELLAMFTRPVDQIVGAAGRLSPEKGFGVLVDAAAEVIRRRPTVGFIHFGDGQLREQLAAQIDARGIRSNFLLAGFRSDLDRLLPNFDIFALPSFTEGLPNVVLEAFAAGVPVVATAVGGTPELVEDGLTGRLTPPGDPQAFADRLNSLIDHPRRAATIAAAAKNRVTESFSFASQATAYKRLFVQLGLEPVTGTVPTAKSLALEPAIGSPS